MRALRRLIDAIEAEGSAALVTLTRVEGSSPREAGVRMVVRPSGGFHGTIGGGALEWVALDAAQAALKHGRGPAERRSVALGPELAQRCGGRVEWRIETFDWRDLADLSPIVEAESEGRTSLKASTRSDGRVERMVEEDRRGGRIDREPANVRRLDGAARGERSRGLCVRRAPCGAGGRAGARARCCRSWSAGSTRVARLFLPTRRRMSR